MKKRKNISLFLLFWKEAPLVALIPTRDSHHSEAQGRRMMTAMSRASPLLINSCCRPRPTGHPCQELGS